MAYTTRGALDGALRSPDTYIGNKVAALTSAAAISLDPTAGNVFTLTPAQTATISAASVVNGQEIALLIYTSGASSFTITFGTNFRSSGTLLTGVTTGKVFVICFVSDGTNYVEISRTAALA